MTNGMCIVFDQVDMILTLGYDIYLMLNNVQSCNISHCHCWLFSSFSALILLVWCQEEHMACKNWVMRYWCGYLSGARCRLFACGPADATVSKTPLSLASFKFILVLSFWYRLIDNTRHFAVMLPSLTITAHFWPLVTRRSSRLVAIAEDNLDTWKKTVKWM